MSVVGSVPAAWAGNTTVLVQGFQAQPGDLVVCAFVTTRSASHPTHAQTDMRPGWDILSVIPLAGEDYVPDWASQPQFPAVLVVAVKKYETATTVVEEEVTVRADRGPLIGAGVLTHPLDLATLHLRGEKSVTVAQDKGVNPASTLNLTALAPLTATATASLAWVGITDGANALLGDSTLTPTRYARQHTRLTTTLADTQAPRAYRADRVTTITWADGTREDRVFPGAPINYQRITLAAAPEQAVPTGEVADAPRWVSTTATWAVRVQPRTAGAGAPTGWALKYTQSTTSGYWDASQYAWRGTEVINPMSTLPADGAVRFPGGALTPSTAPVALSAKVTTAASSGTYGTAVTIDVSPRPTASHTVIKGTTGASEGTMRAAVTAAPTAGRVLLGWDAELVNGEGTVVDSATSASLAPVTLTAPRGGVYTVRSRVRQSEGGVSADCVSTVALSATLAPTKPTVTAGAGRDTTSLAPVTRIIVDFPWALEQFAWGEKEVTLRVHRSIDGGPDTLVALLGPYFRKTGFALTDASVPSGATATYTVRGEAKTRTGERVTGEWSAPTAAVRTIVECGWIVDPTAPEKAVKVTLVEDKTRTYNQSPSVEWPLGATEPVLSVMPTRGATGSLTVRVHDATAESRALALLTSGAPLLVRWHPEINPRTGVATPPRDLWVRVTSAPTSTRTRPGPDTTREIEFDYAAINPPAVVDGWGI